MKLKDRKEEKREGGLRKEREDEIKNTEFLENKSHFLQKTERGHEGDL